LAINQFPKIRIRETGEVIETTNPDEFALVGTLSDGALFTAHFEAGKRSGAGVQIDIAGADGDIRIINDCAFGGVENDYVMIGARGDKRSLTLQRVPDKYRALRGAKLPTTVSELAGIYAAIALDKAAGTSTAPTFRDALRMQKLIVAAMDSSESGCRVSFDGAA
jgi:predicted dehydrogenase